MQVIIRKIWYRIIRKKFYTLRLSRKEMLLIYQTLNNLIMDQMKCLIQQYDTEEVEKEKHLAGEYGSIFSKVSEALRAGEHINNMDMYTYLLKNEFIPEELRTQSGNKR